MRLLVLFPLFILVALALWLDDRNASIAKQLSPKGGFVSSGGNVFKCVKFDPLVDECKRWCSKDIYIDKEDKFLENSHSTVKTKGGISGNKKATQKSKKSYGRI